WHDQNKIWKVRLRRNPFDWKKHQWDCFLNCIKCLTIRNSARDLIAWGLISSGFYSVSLFRTAMEDLEGSDGWLIKLPWRGIFPQKVNFFTWQLLRGRVFVRDVLRRFGMGI
ncbi:hypothetical protein Dsin_004441, partial [Dipteronia sinensis]